MTAHANDVPMNLDIACHLNVLVAEATPVAVERALDGLARFDVGRVVLPPLDPRATDVDALRAIFDRHGVSPITLAGQMPGADVSSADAAERAAGAAMLRDAVHLTAGLGGTRMNGVPYGIFGSPSAPTTQDRLTVAAKEVGRVADEAGELGITMTFEVLNRYETSAINTAAQAMWFAQESGSDNLRIHLDTFHMGVEEADISTAVREALPRLSYLELGQSGRGPLSTGAIDIPAVVRQALDDGYRGGWGIEAFSRSVLSDGAADMLAIWRSPYADGAELVADALRCIRIGWAASTVGRRELRIARGAMV